MDDDVRGWSCVVTGGSGFVGQRLVTMVSDYSSITLRYRIIMGICGVQLCERGAKRVVSFDISPAPPNASSDSRIQYTQGIARQVVTVCTIVLVFISVLEFVLYFLAIVKT